MRWLGYGIAALCAGYPMVLIVSLTGAPVRPETLVPGLPKPTASKSTERVAPLLIGTVPSASIPRVGIAPSPPSAVRTRPQAAPSGPRRKSRSVAAMPSPTVAPPASPSSTPSDSTSAEAFPTPSGNAEQ